MRPLPGRRAAALRDRRSRLCSADWGRTAGTRSREHHLEKEFLFRDFVSALAFVNRVGELAEREGHHPDVHLAWGKVRLTLWTHKIDGLTESDFVLAAKADTLLVSD